MLDRPNCEHRTAGLTGWLLSHEARALGPISTDGIDRWKRELSPYRVWLIERAARAEMPRFGYARSTHSPRPHYALRFHLGRAQRRLRALLGAVRRAVREGAS